MKSAKQLRHFIDGNADARVLHHQFDQTGGLPQPDRDGAALRREFDRVGDNIANRGTGL